MKKILILMLFVIGLTNVYAQMCNHAEKKTKLMTAIVSREDSFQSGIVKYFLKLKASDTLVVDSIVLKSNYFNNFTNNGSFPISLFNGDSIMIEITLNYDSNNLPFYYKSIDHYIISHKDSTLNSIHLSSANIYFTPYGTTEIWNMEDFYALPRIWNISDSIEPQRVFIHRDSIPLSNLTPLDSNHEKWEEDFQQVEVSNLPYAILMKAIHPDTLGLYFSSDTTLLDSNINPTSFTILKRFRGRVTGSLRCNYRNDLGNLVSGGIPLGGVKVKIKSKGPVHKTIASSYTNDNGEFDISYDVITFFDGDQIELYINFETDCEKFNFKVENDNKTFLLRRDIGNHGKFAGTINVGSILLENDDKNPFKITNFTYLMYRFFENLAPAYKPTSKLQIMLFLNKTSHYVLDNQKLYLQEGDERHESTIWHELGHYVMDELMQNNHDYIGGPHALNDEINFQFAFVEGWASGFAGFLDFYYHNIDNESGITTWLEGGILPNGDEVRAPLERLKPAIFLGNNGIRCEYFIICFLNDLFDGPSHNSNTDLYSDVSSVTAPNNGYSGGNSDNIEIDPKILFKVLNEHHNKSIFEYISNLLFYIPNDCNYRKDLKIVIQENFLSLSKNNFTTTGNSVSTDEICFFNTSFTENFIFNGQNVFSETNYHGDISELNSANNSYNLGFNTSFSPYFKPNTLTDNLVIMNNGTLSFNKYLKSGFAFQTQIGGFPSINSTHYSQICSKVISVQNNGFFIVGDENGTTNAIVDLNSGSSIELKSSNSSFPSFLIINNNSKLVINEGAKLIIYPNTELILDGPNAILEIRGEIQLMNGGTLTILGGNNGKGFIRFVNDGTNANKPKLINSPNNSGWVDINGLNSNKTFEIIGEGGLHIGEDIQFFNLENANIKLGLNSRLKLEVKEDIYIINTKFERLNSNDEFYGILIKPTEYNNFNNNRIFGAKNALTIYSNNSNQQTFKINKLFVNNCETGVFINNSNILMENSLISGYQIVGLRSLSQNLPNVLRNVKVHNSLSIPSADGIIIEGSSVANALTTISNSRIENNRIGINANMATLRLLSCNLIINNDKGINMDGWSLLDKSNLSYSKFEGNTIHFLSRYHGTLQMINGHNAYYGQNPNNQQTVFWASLQPNQPNIINNNQMNASTNYFEAPLIYSLLTPNCWLDERGTRVLTFANINTTYSSLSNYLSNNTCTYLGDPLIDILPGNGGDLGHAFSIPIYGGLNGTQITCTPFSGGTSIIAAYQPLHDSVLLSNNPNISQILPQLCVILNCQVANPSLLHQQLLVDVFNTTILAHSLGVLNKQVSVDSNGVDSLSDLMISTIDNLISFSQNNSAPWKDMLFQLKIAKTEVQRLANYRVPAINDLEAMQVTHTDSFELELIARNLCIHNAELALINDSIKIEEILNYYPCFKEQNSGNAMKLSAFKLKEKEKNNLIFYPNPSSQDIFISTKNNEKILSISIYNLEGKLILSIDKIDENNNLYDISLLTSGSYIIEVTTENNTYNKLLIKQ